MTQHEMKNIGNGMPLDAPLTYAVTVKHPKLIGTSKGYFQAKSAQDAMDKASFHYFGYEVVRVELI